MPNIKSKKKRAITNLKRNAHVSSEKSALKTAIKNVLKAVEENDKDAAVAAFNNANSALDKSFVNGLHHKNYVARQKARLQNAVNSLQ